MTSSKHPVAIIGAGPVGLFTAFQLAQSGIKVILHESGKGIDQSPRAGVYSPPVLEEFAKAGIIEDVIKAGQKASDGVDWKDPDGNVLASINPPPNDSSFVVTLSQPELGAILLTKLLDTGNAEVVFNESLTRTEQDDDGVTYWTKKEAGSEEVERQCQYLIGADGGRSTVRRNLGIKLEGFTFETLQFVAVNFQYPLSELGWKSRTSIVDPEDWGIVVRRGNGRSWRFVTGVRVPKVDNNTVLDEGTIQTVKNRLARILPGDTSKLQYEGMAPYLVHQRCASRYREGRVMLAGDAAHLNNPVGGLGLTTGLLDAAHLSKALKEVLQEGANTRVLTTYAETRRRIFREITDPVSQAGMRRLYSQEPSDVKERAEVFAQLNDPKNFMTPTKIGLPDFSITSTSDRIFDTQAEVTWFISVKKIPDWSTEKFTHEYKTVHADMTRHTNGRPQPVTRYIQLSNTSNTIEGTEVPPWDYVTCLTMPSLFILHAGFSDPGYKATAGAHIFCQLDQQGCITTQVAKHSKGNSSDNSDIGAVECLVFHTRIDACDDYSDSWFSERSAEWEHRAISDDRLKTYILFRDVLPKDTEYLFRDTQFSEGKWGDYKAVEAFHFANDVDAAAFMEEYRARIYSHALGATLTVIGVPDVVL